MSTDGDPGLYVVDSEGGTPRLLFVGNYVWPADMRFSPDGRTIVCIIDRQVALVDVTTGSSSYPTYTHSEARFPDWSPDGRYIVYERPLIWRLPPDPVDSTGIHIYEPATGADRPLRRDGHVVIGFYPVWSADGKYIAYASASDPESLMIMTASGSDSRVLGVAGPGDYFSNLRWYRRVDTGEDGVLTVSLSKSQFFPVHGGAPRPWRYNGTNDYSGDGRRFVANGWQLPDSASVLFVQDTDDFSGASRRQLTFYRYIPPAAATSATAAERIHELLQPKAQGGAQ